ncbi:class II aldolase/adducin family protein [Clostridium polynesiense]|uniref:class II aldolase/adducin family protein n=1 Tax=Clostridium polynesiense TaxID=1325933 RepID=UPI00058BAD07|nr:class II aldolase/adducin family protein [Clostridium polynesiense]
MKEWNEIKKRVKEVATRAYKEGLVAGTSGNVSYYDRESNKVFITPTNGDYLAMKPEDIVVINLDGEVVEGKFKPSSEWLLHVELYKHYDHVNSVIHTHSPYATGFAIVDEKIPLILVEMLPFLGGDIPVARFGMPGTSEVGLHAVDVMANRNAALLQNHGVVAVGNTPEQAYIRAIYVEDAAKAYHYAKLMGEPQMVPEKAQDILRERYNLKK